MLLKEVVAADDAFSRPFSNECWIKIAKVLVLLRPKLDGVSSRSVKERAERLGKQHKASDNWRLKQ